MIDKDKACRNIYMAVVWQAVKDYFKSTSAKKNAILKELRSEYICAKTDGVSKNVADELEKNPDESSERLKIVLEEEQQ